MRHESLVKKIFKLLRHLDLMLLVPSLLITIFGVAMVYSVTKPSAELLGVGPHSYLYKQAAFAIVGILAMIIIISLDYRFFEMLAYLIYGLSVLSLIAVFGTPRHLGSQRWFQLGPVQLQPSEFALLAVILALAKFLSTKQDLLSTKDVVLSLVMIAIPEALIYKQPDLGTAIVLGVVSFVMLVLAGAKGRHIFALIVLGILATLAVVSLGVLHQYQIARLSVFLHPKNVPASEVYNLQQSENAIGSGGLLGVGFGNGPETNLAFVPEQQTDFIFTAVGEQFGFVGSVILLGLYLIILYRLVRAMFLSRDKFGKLLAAGALGLIGFSVIENAGMTMGVMPVAGIPLPFMSYGGSAMVVFWVAIGLVLSVEMRRFQLKKAPSSR
jgi:rod shape determining protein RodA